jgi:hypothetical protein
MKIIKIIFFICFSLLINLTYAQVFEDDAMLFLGINAEKKVNDKFTIAINEQVRFNQNISNFQQANTTLLIYYKINKNLKVDVGYNNRQKNELEGYFSYRNRYFASIYYKYKLKKLTFTNRLRYQTSTYSDIENSYSNFIRYKLSLKYNLNTRMDFSVSNEINCPLFNANALPISRNRSSAEFTYRFTKKINTEIYFMFQRKYNYKGAPRRQFIFGVNLNFEF